MKPRWDDLNARARGLSTHLLRRSRLEELATLPDLPALGAELARLGYVIDETESASAAGLELAVRRAAAARLRTLVRWFGARRSETLAVIVEDEDRRSLRALLRGAVQGAPAEERLAGLLPTPTLPERALEELARQPTAAAVATLLGIWRHPAAPALGAALAGPEPDLLGLEAAINHTFAARAARGARQAGRRGWLARYVRELIDVENGYTALLLAAEWDAAPRPDLFLPGGGVLSPADAGAAAASGDPGAAARRVAAAFVGTRLAPAFGSATDDPAGLEGAVLRAQIAELRSATRHDPLSAAPLLEFALRLRAELLDLRWIIWGLSLGAPRGTLTPGLATRP